jgi:oligosaccharyltransferase complex subunit alpha (ribophorin I)
LSVYGHGQTSVVKSFTAVLPPAVTDVYYKDIVGNISTSNLRSERKQTILDFRPRYPLYGGWKFTWFYGYTMPQETLLSPVSGKSEEFRFKATMTPSVSGLAVEKSTLKVILPEGATYISD